MTRTQGNNPALKAAPCDPTASHFDFVEVPVLVQASGGWSAELEFDICEMALTTYLVAKAHGVRFTAVPVVPGPRLPPRRDPRTTPTSGITDAQGSRGRRVGVNRGYTVTTGVWARGDPADETASTSTR